MGIMWKQLLKINHQNSNQHLIVKTQNRGDAICRLKKLLNGNRIKFNTPAAAFMYLNSLGWELYINGATTEGAMYGGIGGSTTTSYWIMRKPCTKEEFEQAVEQGIKK